jgi:MFS family permease
LPENELNLQSRSLLRNLLATPAMRFRDFRLLWIAGIFNSTGFIGEQVVLGWLVLELTDSTLMVGATLALRMVPFLLLGVIAGAVADRVDRRKLLRLVSISMAALSVAIGLIIMLDIMALWHLMLQHETLRILLILSSSVEILGFSHQVLLPVLARDVLEVGAEGLGLMNALRSVGGIVAILALSSLGEVRRKGLLYLVALHIFGISLLFLGIANTFYFAILAIIVINGMGALSDILSQSLVQTVVPDELRGRAMGSWVLAVGLGPVGHLQIGALASAFGVSMALLAHATGLIILSVGAFAFFPKIRKL